MHGTRRWWVATLRAQQAHLKGTLQSETTRKLSTALLLFDLVLRVPLDRFSLLVVLVRLPLSSWLYANKSKVCFVALNTGETLQWAPVLVGPPHFTVGMCVYCHCSATMLKCKRYGLYLNPLSANPVRVITARACTFRHTFAHNSVCHMRSARELYLETLTCL